MYLPQSFKVTEPGPLQQLIARYPLATLCVSDATGLAADHIPMLLRPGSSTTTSEQPDANADWGYLVGHIARANPLAMKAATGIPCLAIFQAVQGYVSPNHYATKSIHGKVVPTWNYQVVHCHGRLTTISDRDWIEALVRDLTHYHEQSQATPWLVGDAPRDYLDQMLQAIVGVELQIERVEGKFKMSQNQPAENIASLMQSLSHGTIQEQDLAQSIQEFNKAR